MKKILLISFLFFISCDTSNECGEIIDKYTTLTGKYYFTLINRVGTQTSSNIGGAGGEAEVTKEIYDSFNIGDEYAWNNHIKKLSLPFFSHNNLC